MNGCITLSYTRGSRGQKRFGFSVKTLRPEVRAPGPQASRRSFCFPSCSLSVRLGVKSSPLVSQTDNAGLEREGLAQVTKEGAGRARPRTQVSDSQAGALGKEMSKRQAGWAGRQDPAGGHRAERLSEFLVYS